MNYRRTLGKTVFLGVWREGCGTALAAHARSEGLGRHLQVVGQIRLRAPQLKNNQSFSS
jgi:hypothetical protein